MHPENLTFHSPAVRQDPYAFYTWLREHSPVHWCAQTNAYLISRHADVLRVVRHPEDFSSVAMRRQETGPDQGERGTRNIITVDPPEHTRLRNILQREFLNRPLESLQPRIDTLAAGFLRRTDEQRIFDLVDTFTIPFPVTVIAEIMGIEPERRADFKHWSNCLVGVLSEREGPLWKKYRAGVFELVNFFSETFSQRRATGREYDDLLGLLLKAEDEDRIDIKEMVSYCTLLLTAGNETTTDLIGGMVPQLLTNPEQLQLLQDDPSLIPRAIEEGLRHCSPVQGIYRRAVRDIEISGTVIRAGRDVAPLFGAANRDPRKFPAPDAFDITRETSGHVGFGYGIHFCLGAHLARREARAALTELLPRLAHMRVAEPDIPWKPGWLIRGPKRLLIENELAA